MVCFGPIGVILIFLLLVTITGLYQRFVGGFPSLGSRFISAWGIQAVLDPVLILIVDSAKRRWRVQDDQAAIGDAFKLYHHFDRSDDSGLPGIFLTVCLYLIFMFTASVIFYIYFLKWHMNGRMLDVYQRLSGKDDDYFLPYDMEISNEELNFIVKKAEQWRGSHGERRKVWRGGGG